MQENRNFNNNLDGYLCKLENLSSQIAESISLGNSVVAALSFKT